jgi:hypothetical protein
MQSWTSLVLGASLATFVAGSFVACSIHDPENETTEPSSGSGGAGATGTSAGGSGITTSGTGGEGATPGEVACGTNTCEVPAEKCCGSMGSCVASTETCPTIPCGFYCAGDASEVVEISCDDSGDCSDGQVCCKQAAGDGNVSLSCAAAPCDYHEVCQPDGNCSDGQACVSSKLELTGAKCTGAAPKVPCGESDCAGESSVCCNDDAAAPTCVGVDNLTCAAMYECNGAADCGPGYSCCFDGLRASCSNQCTTVLCDEAGDCPAATPSCVEIANDVSPPGFKSCQ